MDEKKITPRKIFLGGEEKNESSLSSSSFSISIVLITPITPII
jgi:hypothetical protein